MRMPNENSWEIAQIGGHRRYFYLIVGILAIVWAVAAVGLFVGDHRSDAFNVFLLSIPGAFTLIAAVLVYRSPKTGLESSATPEGLISGHEEESAILMRALEVFGESERALEWMRESNPALQNQTPIRAIQTGTGRREVEQILGRIQHGVIS